MVYSLLPEKNLNTNCLRACVPCNPHIEDGRLYEEALAHVFHQTRRTRDDTTARLSRCRAPLAEGSIGGFNRLPRLRPASQV
ncbi:MAG: hypothetical protein MSG64_10365 [Pyrinomonadaceae bacterium MAG19_C2-C3]|nr:hypothetical protein [Pyrinomonadaceae bacterium MAG19_C2-C3]